MAKTPKNEPSKFSVKGSWAFYDCLGDIQIEDKDKIRIFWPDKTEEIFTVSVLETTTKAQDMGSTWNCPTTKAFIKIKHNGSVINVRLTEIPELKACFKNDVSGREKIK